MSQLTVLQAAGRCLTKSFERDARARSSREPTIAPACSNATCMSFKVSTGCSICKPKLQGRRDCCVIHAPPGRWHPGAGKLAPRRLYAAGELADDSGRLHKPARKGSAEL